MYNQLEGDALHVPVKRFVEHHVKSMFVRSAKLELELEIHIYVGIRIDGLNISILFLIKMTLGIHLNQLSNFERFLLRSGYICASNVNHTFAFDDANSMRGLNVSAHQPWLIFLCIPN